MLKIHHTFQFPTCTKHVVRVVVPFRHPGAVLCCFLKILCAQQLVERRWRLLARHGQRRDVDSVEAFQSNCWRMPAMCCIVKAVAQGERKKRDTVISCCLFAKGTCFDESDLRLFLLKHIVKNERSHQLRLTERSHALRITSKMCVLTDLNLRELEPNTFFRRKVWGKNFCHQTWTLPVWSVVTPSAGIGVLDTEE